MPQSLQRPVVPYIIPDPSLELFLGFCFWSLSGVKHQGGLGVKNIWVKESYGISLFLGDFNKMLR